MYIETWKEKEEFWGAVCYRTESELIEADGEAEQLFLEQVVADQYPSQYFQAIDWKSNDVIDLDIADYINQNTYDLFEGAIMHIDESETFSYTKAESYYRACLAQTCRRNKR